MGLSMQAKVGIVITIAVLILGGMIVWKGDIFLKAQGYELIGSFENIGGLIEGSEVRYRGYKVGKVIRIVPGIEDTKAYIFVNPEIKVPEGSTLRVAFDGLIGQKYLEIVPGVSEKALKPRSMLKGYSTLGLVDFIDIGTINLQELERILSSVRKITDDPFVQKAAKGAMINVEAATFQLTRVARELNKVLARGGIAGLIDSLRVSSDSVVRVTKRLEGITESVEKITGDPTFAQDIKDTAKKAREAMEEIKRAAEDVRKTLKKMAK